MSDEELDHAGTTYFVPAEVWHRAKIVGTVGVAAGVLIAAASLVGYAAAGTDNGMTVGLAGMIFGVVVAAYGSAIAWGARRAVDYRFALTVAPAGLVVDSGGSSTTIAWEDVEQAETVVESPQKLTLEIRPRPGHGIAFPRRVGPRKPALPQPCREHPGNVRVFSLTLLGARSAECLNEIEEYVPVRDRAAGQAGS